MSFESMGLAPYLLNTLSSQKYDQAYPIQNEAIPAILNKRDVLGIAPTGSGKTASYVLPVLMNLQEKNDIKNRHIEVLVLVPTRELAAQVSEVFNIFSKNLPNPVNTLAVFGGVSINPQMMAIQGVRILVATPGRLLELIESNAVHISEIKTLILDEADKMLNMGFKMQIERIFELLPPERQNLLFSATLSDDAGKISTILLKNPHVIKLGTKEYDIELIKQSAYMVSEDKKGPLLRYLINHNNLQQVLVFTSSIFKAESVVNKLVKNGIDAEAIHGKRSQHARTEVLRQFKNGKLRVMVTTDLLARGIDIEFLPHVINYELPRSPKDYIHRIGRTGRAESPGEAISIITPEELPHFKVIQKKMGKVIPLTESLKGIDIFGNNHRGS
ncbi:MAG: DEAD/DEAH box helicase [Bacteroidetes bacterium]|jgi:ATP-dependent RNA helicase RhlE|nr:DEAD/DEAH box helicase [Bacteroidota bacterium]MBT3747668.1 DEAD/DEAH box helicase [Bacteroidota bacterium]MBT4411481.1 DEAD/DEAH box helicase [Bacteroidota bacterium]MBT5426913.1 DEAD/DEAH box helicase [Bacteroidota bacterium]MBT7465943.1 DEAD/DEAH box helicase [Bacteroidota bacterium]